MHDINAREIMNIEPNPVGTLFIRSASDIELNAAFFLDQCLNVHSLPLREDNIIRAVHGLIAGARA